MFPHVPRVLIVFGAWHGRTELLARRLALLARRHGYHADVQSARAAWGRADLDSFDRFMICTGVQMRHHHRDVAAFVRTHLELLSSRPSALVSVGLSGDAPKERADHTARGANIDDVSATIGWSPATIIHCGGHVHFTHYGFLTRWFMRRISAERDEPTQASSDHNRMDWSRLEADAAAFLSQAPHTVASSAAGGV